MDNKAGITLLSLPGFFCKLYGSFLGMGLYCLKATEPLQGDSLLFTI